jgi:predicted Zn-dependent peptidase
LAKVPLPPPFAPLSKVIHEVIYDEVVSPRVLMVFRSPAHFEPGDAELDILASILTSGKTSRLFKALVGERALADSVSARQDSLALSGIFSIEATVRRDASPAAVERVMDAVLKDIIAKPPSEAELRAAQSELEFKMLCDLRTPAGRANIMNEYWVKRDDPALIAQHVTRYRDTTPASVLTHARRAITLDGRLILRVLPANSASVASPEKP